MVQTAHLRLGRLLPMWLFALPVMFRTIGDATSGAGSTGLENQATTYGGGKPFRRRLDPLKPCAPVLPRGCRAFPIGTWPTRSRPIGARNGRPPLLTSSSGPELFF